MRNRKLFAFLKKKRGSIISNTKRTDLIFLMTVFMDQHHLFQARVKAANRPSYIQERTDFPYKELKRGYQPRWYWEPLEFEIQYFIGDNSENVFLQWLEDPEDLKTVTLNCYDDLVTLDESWKLHGAFIWVNNFEQERKITIKFNRAFLSM